MIIDFNRSNGGGSGSGSTDLTNYWNSAVTEERIESAASITYASGVSYTDAAVAGIVVPDLTNYWDSAVTEEQIASAASIVYASANSYTDAAVAGIDLSAYALSADVESLSAATAGKADAKIMVDFDHTSQAERAAIYAELKTLYDGGSGSSINKLYDFFKTVNTWQGLKIDYYGFSGDTLVFGTVVSPENITDQVVYEQVMVIDAAGNVNVVTNSVGGGPDLSAYYTSAQTDAAISAATSGKADAANVTARNDNVMNRFWFPKWNEQGIIVGDGGGAAWKEVRNWFNGVSFQELNTNGVTKTWYAPISAGTAGEVLVSTGSGAPVWSAVTIPDMSEYTPTSGFSTINGSAITNGGNLVIQGGGGPAGDPEILKGVMEFPADPENGDLVSKIKRGLFWDDTYEVSGYQAYRLHINTDALNTNQQEYEIASILVNQNEYLAQLWYSNNEWECLIKEIYGSTVSAITLEDHIQEDVNLSGRHVVYMADDVTGEGWMIVVYIEDTDANIEWEVHDAIDEDDIYDDGPYVYEDNDWHSLAKDENVIKQSDQYQLIGLQKIWAGDQDMYDDLAMEGRIDSNTLYIIVDYNN